jgi:beta-galactosidase/beta-glucuronidase
MYARDKNRPSVVMWSLGSDTQSQKGSSRTYWQYVSFPTHLTCVCSKRQFITLQGADWTIASLGPEQTCYSGAEQGRLCGCGGKQTMAHGMMTTRYYRATSDLSSQGGYFDVVCINRFYSWDSDPGHTELIQRQVASDVAAWRNKYGKPIIVTAYGADTLGGLHLVTFQIL